jgi:hypothetical protein
MRRLARLLVDEDPYVDEFTAQELAEQFIELDEWLEGGGFIPRDWREARGGRER